MPRFALALALAATLALALAAPGATGGAGVARADEGFVYGSYGRVGVGTDLRGSTPRPVNVVAHGARVVEAPYLELDLGVRRKPSETVAYRIVTTLALFGDPFHYTGSLDPQLGLRNLFLETDLPGDVSLWVGSRLYRGDDIYLLDYWPLDSANTLGGGARWRRGRLDLAAHAGANRLLDPFTFQQIDVPARELGATPVVTMDRQRLSTSLKGTHRFFGPPEGPALKAKLFLEAQALAAGTRRRTDGTREDLPADFGWSAGAELGAWGFGGHESFGNLFLRFSQGLTAFGDLGVPTGLGPDKRVFPDASELVLGLSANHELGRAGVLAGGYLRRFVDADPTAADPDDGWEWIADVRPWFAVHEGLQAAVDVSYQRRLPRGPSPTALVPLEPAVFQLAPMVLYAPGGAGSYSRPQLRLVYRLAHLDEGARDLYPLEDPRRGLAWVHYLGVQAEWWFNSSYR